MMGEMGTTMAITITESAARHIASNLSKRGKGMGLRLGVRTSGCSGLAYKLEYADEIRPEDSVHSLIAVHTDAGITGYGSVFTNGGLVGAALKVLEPSIFAKPVTWNTPLPCPQGNDSWRWVAERDVDFVFGLGCDFVVGRFRDVLFVEAA